MANAIPIVLTVAGSFWMQTGSGPARVKAQGRLEPAGGVFRIGAMAGARVGTVHVNEGAAVKKGEVLVVLDGDMERRLELELLNRQAADLGERLELERAHHQLLLQEWELQKRRADELETIELPAQRKAVERIRESAKIAESQLERLSGLYQAGSIPRDQWEKQEIEIRRVRSERESAEQNLLKLERSAVNGRTDLQVQKSKLDLNLRRTEASLSLRTVEIQRKLAEARVEAGRIKAPIDGKVLRVAAKPGEMVGAAPLVQVGDTDHMHVSAEVDEMDVLAVRVGQKATIKALGQSLTGVVASVGNMVARNELMSLDPTARSDARVVEVKIRLDASEWAGRFTNLQVDVEIDTRAAP